MKLPIAFWYDEHGVMVQATFVNFDLDDSDDVTFEQEAIDTTYVLSSAGEVAYTCSYPVQIVSKVSGIVLLNKLIIYAIYNFSSYTIFDYTGELRDVSPDELHEMYKDDKYIVIDLSSNSELEGTYEYPFYSKTLVTSENFIDTLSTLITTGFTVDTTNGQPIITKFPDAEVVKLPEDLPPISVNFSSSPVNMVVFPTVVQNAVSLFNFDGKLILPRTCKSSFSLNSPINITEPFSLPDSVDGTLSLMLSAKALNTMDFDTEHYIAANEVCCDFSGFDSVTLRLDSVKSLNISDIDKKTEVIVYCRNCEDLEIVCAVASNITVYSCGHLTIKSDSLLSPVDLYLDNVSELTLNSGLFTTSAYYIHFISPEKRCSISGDAVYYLD